jgi:hypothetical protein
VKPRADKNETHDLAVWPEKVIGGKYVRLLEKVLRGLRAEETHGNRELFLDDVFVSYLLAFHNPTIRSLRTIEDFSQTKQAQRHLSIRKVCKSTLSDFNQIANPERLRPIITALQQQLNRKSLSPGSRTGELNRLLQKTIAVDGTFLPAAADVVWSICNSNQHGKKQHRARVDCHLHVDTWIPETIVVPDPGQSESDSAAANLKPGNIYVYDRAYSKFSLIDEHYDTTSGELLPRASFLIRYKPAGGNSPTLENAEERPLSKADQECGVTSDRVGCFLPSNVNRHSLLAVALREVLVTYHSNGEDKQLRLITNLLDVSAATIAHLYRFRWQVELFFRWLKCVGNFNHLISHSREGVQLHLYVTIIAVMLMYLHTGYRPSKYMLALVGQVANGAATLDEIMPILRERERRCELDRQSRARRELKKGR